MHELERLIAGGESESLELKRSTAQLRRAGETLCAFLNGLGGRVILGVAPNGRVVGQEISDKTRREIAGMLDRFEPPSPVTVAEVELPGHALPIIVLDAPAQEHARPFTFGLLSRICG